MANASTLTALNECHAHVTADGYLLVGNALVTRRWATLADGSLRLVSLFDKAIGREWVAGDDAAMGERATATVDVRMVDRHPVHRPSLRATVTCGPVRYAIDLFPESTGIGLRRLTESNDLAAEARPDRGAPSQAPSGIETGTTSPPDPHPPAKASDVLEWFTLRPRHLRLTQVELVDQTDANDNLVFEREWLLSDRQGPIEASGNLFFLEDCLSGDGLIFLRPISLPHARPVKWRFDLRLHGRQLAIGGGGACVTIPYGGGRTGRIVALHGYQREWRPYVPERDVRFLSNTWGDRSRDARINEAFLLGEIEAGHRLGVEVIQIDDGWQRGRSANSAEQGGVWNGFWATDERFWEPHPQRLPNGLAPLVRAADARGMRVGLWYAPDSSDNFANWNRDAQQVLQLHREQGISYIKIDGVKVHAALGERNLRQFYDAVLIGSDGQVAFDHDVTAEVRPSYFGVIDIGTVFVENRYTDWHNYWPHRTLRNLWMLAQHVDPARLRMEFLNHARNADRYADDPIAPACYGPDYLFATVMFASPLGWFEISNLPDSYFGKVAPLAAIWKEHRDAIFSGTIIPIGPAPDGAQVTGFLAKPDTEAGGYLLLFRELCATATIDVDLPRFAMRSTHPIRLAGEGTIALDNNVLRATLPAALRFMLIKL
jgi:alpha-galactosidase